MTGWAYYNDNEAFACEWTRNLIKAGLIPDGEVDDRSIAEVQPDDLMGFRQRHFFSGIAGWSLALQTAGWPSDRPVWSASCPCPPFSSAGKRQTCPKCSSRLLVWCPRRTGFAICSACGEAWLADARHLWPEVWRLAAIRRPERIFGEQVQSVEGIQWLAGVRGSLEILGYAVGAADLPACSVGAPHIRQRLYWVADSQRDTGRAGRSPEQSRSGDEEARTGSHDESGQCRYPGVVADTERRPTERPGSELAGPSSGAAGEVWDQRVRADLGDGRNSIILADSDARGRRQQRPSSLQRPRDEDFNGFSQDSGLADTDGGISGDRDLQRGRGRRQQPEDGGFYWSMGNASERRQRIHRSPSGSSGHADQSGKADGSPLGDSSVQRLSPSELERLCGPGWRSEGRAVEQSGGSFWTDYDLIACTDGKARRVEPSIFQMATGISDALGSLRPDLRERIEAAFREGYSTFPLADRIPGRVGKLRAYGNAIVPPLAAEFIKAFMETIEDV